MRAILSLLLWSLPGLVLAEATPPAPLPSVGFSGTGLEDSLTRMLSGLLLVVSLIFLLGWLVRRLQLVPRQAGQVIQVLANQPLGPRERLVLVQVGEQQLLLAFCHGQITPLHVLETPVVIPEAAPAATSEFAQRLMEFMSRDKDKA